jgi:hypothetical protein
METFSNLIYITLFLALGIGTYIAAKDQTRSPIRIYLVDITCGVIMGCLAGYQRNDISSGLMLGVLIGLLFVLVGAVSRWQIKQFTNLQQKPTKKK